MVLKRWLINKTFRKSLVFNYLNPKNIHSIIVALMINKDELQDEMGDNHIASSKNPVRWCTWHYWWQNRKYKKMLKTSIDARNGRTDDSMKAHLIVLPKCSLKKFLVIKSREKDSTFDNNQVRRC
jgi:hypothetical protein